MRDLKNSDLFKYSPYKTLTEDQFLIASNIVEDIKKGKANTYIVDGKPGTGKTILATYLFKYLKEQEETKHLTVGLVVPMTSLRKTIKKVFKKIKGLSSGMVIGPNDVIKKSYDLLIVDEAHRLQRRKNIMGYGAYDAVNKKLGLPKESTQLDWVLLSSKNQILFYDPNQSIKPADVRAEDFSKLTTLNYTLSSQKRVQAGEKYIESIESFLALEKPSHTKFLNYDFKIFDDISEMKVSIKEREKEYKLSRMVAGYAWPWHTKPGRQSDQDYDIKIVGVKMIWNSTAEDWVNSPNAINEVGCIHTVQGYDLNYIGVIIGPELKYDPDKKELFIDPHTYFDIIGRSGIHHEDELKGYIINIYKTLLTRGIMGTYVYIVDTRLRELFKKMFRINYKKQ